MNLIAIGTCSARFWKQRSDVMPSPLSVEVNALKRLQAETTAEFDALLPAILDRAFKAEL